MSKRKISLRRAGGTLSGNIYCSKESKNCYLTRLSNSSLENKPFDKKTENSIVDKISPDAFEQNARKRTLNKTHDSTNSVAVVKNENSDCKRGKKPALTTKDIFLLRELPNDATFVSRKLRNSAKTLDNEHHQQITFDIKGNTKRFKTVLNDKIQETKTLKIIELPDPENMNKGIKSNSKNINTRRSNTLQVKQCENRISKKKRNKNDNCHDDDDDFKKYPLLPPHKAKGETHKKSNDVGTKENDYRDKFDPVFKVDGSETSSESDEESDWEEISDNYEEPIKKRKLQAVEITISKKPGSKKSKIEQAMDEIRRRINRKLIQSQYEAHKVHILCLMAIGFKMNSLGNNMYFRGMLLSLIPISFMKKFNEDAIFDSKLWVELRDWFLKMFPLQLEQDHNDVARINMMLHVIGIRTKCRMSELEYIVMFVAFCRSLGMNTRIVYSLQPLPYKAIDILKPRPPSGTFMKKMSLVPNNIVRHVNTQISRSEKEKSLEGANKIKKKKSDIFKDDSDNDDFVCNKSKKRASLKKKDHPGIKKNFGASTTNSGKNAKPKKCDWWVEVYLESSWVTVVGPSLDVVKTEEVEKRLTKPISYILAFNTDNHIKDLTRKYDSNWLNTTSKSRLDEAWWCDLLKNFADDESDESLEEDLLIHDALMNKPFPTSIFEYKNHPLYALQRHLLKYEAIYPSNSVVLGRLKEEPIYARECVHTLCSREKWLIEGRMVLPDQKPYKYVKALLKSGKQRVEMNQMLGLYGKWQTDLYNAALAVNGIVPKNNYENVDLFKPWMLPKGTVHLKGTYYGMGKAARKAGIDAAPAMVGWEFHKGFNHPILDGWVVCEENKDALLDAWKIEHEIEKERMREKKEKGDWELEEFGEASSDQKQVENWIQG